MGRDGKTKEYRPPGYCHLLVGRLLILQKYTIFKQDLCAMSGTVKFCKIITMFTGKEILK